MTCEMEWMAQERWFDLNRHLIVPGLMRETERKTREIILLLEEIKALLTPPAPVVIKEMPKEYPWGRTDICSYCGNIHTGTMCPRLAPTATDGQPL